jgi:hypothetical protein
VNNIPRTTTLRWSAVPDAASYRVEVDYCEDAQCHVAKPLVRRQTNDTSLVFDFVGMQPGRWRVSSVDARGVEGPQSAWSLFRYTV